MKVWNYCSRYTSHKSDEDHYLWFSECDSGLGSASDSGRRSKDQSDVSEKSDGEKSSDDAKPDAEPTVTLEQIKASLGRKPVFFRIFDFFRKKNLHFFLETN